MRKSRQGIITAMVLIMLASAGCAELAKIGQGMQKAGETGTKISETVSPVADSFFPGTGKILTGVSALLTMGGAGLYKLANKRLTAAQAVIQGVSSAVDSKEDIKSAIKNIATGLNIEPYLNKLVQKYDPPATT